MLHHAEYFQRWGWGPHTLPLERKHNTVLMYADDKDADCSNVVREILAKSLSDLQDAPWLDLSVGLVHPRPPSKKMTAFLDECIGPLQHSTSATARFSKHDCASKGDVVALKDPSVPSGWVAARILWFADTGGVQYAAVRSGRCVEHHRWYRQNTAGHSGSLKSCLGIKMMFY